MYMEADETTYHWDPASDDAIDSNASAAYTQTPATTEDIEKPASLSASVHLNSDSYEGIKESTSTSWDRPSPTTILYQTLCAHGLTESGAGDGPAYQVLSCVESPINTPDAPNSSAPPESPSEAASVLLDETPRTFEQEINYQLIIAGAFTSYGPPGMPMPDPMVSETKAEDDADAWGMTDFGTVCRWALMRQERVRNHLLLEQDPSAKPLLINLQVFYWDFQIRHKISEIKVKELTVGRRLGVGASAAVYEVISSATPSLANFKSPIVFKRFFCFREERPVQFSEVLEEVLATNLSSSSRDRILAIVTHCDFPIGFLMERHGENINDKYLPENINAFLGDLAELANFLLGMDGKGRPRDRSIISSILRDGSQVAGQCAAFHPKGMVHSDLKPDNILTSLDPIKTGNDVSVVDFGGSSPVDYRTGKASLIVGTTNYAAPALRRAIERQEDEPRNLDDYLHGTAYDVYSLGIILYELLSGRRFSEVNSARDTEGAQGVLIKKGKKVLRSKLSVAEAEAIIDLLDRCIDEDEAKRPAMREVKKRLEIAAAKAVEGLRACAA